MTHILRWIKDTEKNIAKFTLYKMIAEENGAEQYEINKLTHLIKENEDSLTYWTKKINKKK